MSKFKARPELRALPDPDAVAAFAAGADQRSTSPIPIDAPIATAAPPDDTARSAVAAEIDAAATTAVTKRSRRVPADEAPWEKYDREARPLSGINVRLNDYEHELLKYLAAADDRSIQQTIKRLLIPVAETAARKVRRGD